MSLLTFNLKLNRAILYTYPGGILSSFLLVEPPIAFILTNMPAFITMVTSWYLVFFTPKDLFAQFLFKTGLPFIFGFASDFLRLQLCLTGVTIVSKTHPNAFIYMIVIGTLTRISIFFFFFCFFTILFIF